MGLIPPLCQYSCADTNAVPDSPSGTLIYIAISMRPLSKGDDIDHGLSLSVLYLG